MKAKCLYFGKCSGCTLQQFPYVKQLNDKTKRVRSELGGLLPREAKAENAIAPLVPSPAEQGYRTSGKLCLHEDELGRRSIGLYERGSKKVVAIPQCTVHHPEINKLVEKLFGFGKALPAKLYQHTKKQFQAERLKFVTVRYSPETREFGVIVSHTGVAREALVAWAEAQRIAGVSFYESLLKPDDEDLVLSRDVSHLAGPKTFRFRIADLDFQIDPVAFFQANASLAPDFIKTIAAPHAGGVLVDLYGGFGTYSLQTVERFQKVFGVEANPHSIESAIEHSKRRGLKNVLFTVSSVEDYVKGMNKGDKDKPRAEEVTDIIVNPPRTGLSPQVVRGLLAPGLNKLERLTYVSCDLQTLKRDLRELVRNGVYRIEAVLPFDMFPQTDHIETVVRLKRTHQADLSMTQRSPRTPMTPVRSGESRGPKPFTARSQSQRNSRQTKGRTS